MEITHSLEILKHTRLMSAEPLETFRWKLPQQHQGLLYFQCKIYLDISLNTLHSVHFPQTRCSRQPWDKHTPEYLPPWALNLMNHRPDSPLALTQGSISNSTDIDYVIWCKASIKRESSPNSCLHLKLDLLAIIFLAGTAKSKQNQIPHHLKLSSASLNLHAACRCICAPQMISHLQSICSVLAGAFSVVPIQSGSQSSLPPIPLRCSAKRIVISTAQSFLTQSWSFIRTPASQYTVKL